MDRMVGKELGNLKHEAVGISSEVVVPGCNAISNMSRERAGMIKIDQLPRPANHVALNCKFVDGCQKSYYC
jgi:hypothetical protein